MGVNILSKLKIIAIMLVLISFLVIVPASFAGENQTDIILVSDDNNILTGEYYFDANVSDDNGDGSKYNPYKDFSYSKIESNSVVHFAAGEYYLDGRSYNANNMTFIGENARNTIVYAQGYSMTAKSSLTLCNLTFVKLSITNNGDINAVNTIFKDSSKSVIDSIGSERHVNLVNCTFENNFAQNGGAIYMDGGYLNISDSHFINNYATYNGGAIYTDFANATITSSRFEGNYALNELGGAIYIYNSQLFICDKLEVADNCAMFGGAIASLDSVSKFSNITARNNKAKYYGGAFFAIRHTFNMHDSILSNNSACDGGALYADNIDMFISQSNVYANNRANKTGGAVYSVRSNYYYDSIYDEELNNTFINNSAILEDDVYESNMINLTIGDNDYILFKYASSYDGVLPSSFDLRDLGYVTSVKNQGDDGNCWSFSALAALESAILKASGMSFDLSEENMKNLMSYFSDYGWAMETNKGGYDKMAVGYLTSWLGPVNDTDDRYVIDSLISPVLHSFVHVQNILFLTRDNYTDNDAIKKAIMDYGAVSTSIYWSSAYSNGKDYYYNGNSGANHAVAIVGWDDNYSASNFKNTPPGDGAWIIKNSWGTRSGEQGFYHVSYYDTKCVQLGKAVTYAFILNDTIKYDKNYQYDIAGRTDSFFNTTSTVWYKNKFTATADEYLAAVSTYFEKNTNWDLSVYVNDVLKLTQSGFSLPSYSTIDLNQIIPLKLGDTFEIMFKIAVEGDAGVPISEYVSLNTEIYSENVSFISYDGKVWKDFYDLPWTYPDHTYSSQVACIKAFTVLHPVNSIINLAVMGIRDELVNVSASIFDEYGNAVRYGEVTYDINGAAKKASVINGIARLANIPYEALNNFKATFNAVGYNQSTGSILFSRSTAVTLDAGSEYNPILIAAKVADEYGNKVYQGIVTFIIGNERFKVNVVDGMASLSHVFEKQGSYSVSAYYEDDSGIYYSSNASKDISVIFKDTVINLNFDSFDNVDNGVTIIATVVDNFGQPVSRGQVTFNYGGKSKKVDVADGKASLECIFDNVGMNTVSADYADGYYYNPSGKQITLNVSKIKVNLDAKVDITFNEVIIDFSISSHIDENIDVYVDGQYYQIKSKDGKASVSLNGLSVGKHTIKANIASKVYESDLYETDFAISKSKTQLICSDEIIYLSSSMYYHAGLKDSWGNAISGAELTLKILDKSYHGTTDSSGNVVFKIELDVGSYAAEVSFEGNDWYFGSISSKPLTVKSSIDLPAVNKYTYNSIYSAVLYDGQGNPLKNKQVEVTVAKTIHTAKTGSDGMLNLVFTLSPGTYSISIANPETKEVKTQSVTVVKRIAENKAITMYYGAGTPYKVRVYDDNGNIAKGVKVTFTIAGKSYSRTTDSNGYASIKINLQAKSYTIAATYKGYKVSNKIVVKPTLILKDMSVKKSKTFKYTVKLLSNKGKILKNKKVTVKFRGKTYNAKTNSKGIATFKIKSLSKTGKFALTATYGSAKISKKITVKK